MGQGLKSQAMRLYWRQGQQALSSLRPVPCPLPRSISLMPLGGSITYGIGSADGNGYREQLRQLLTRDNYHVRMVGSRRSGSMENNENEGWRGYRIDQITNKARKSAANYQPDVFLVNAGSNDCVQGFDIAEAFTRLRHLLEVLWDASPRSTIALSTLLPNRDIEIESRVLGLNEQIRGLAKLSTSERKFTLVDFHIPDGP